MFGTALPAAPSSYSDFPCVDPVAMQLLNDVPAQADPSLGVFTPSPQLGFFGIDDAIIAGAIPIVRNLIGSSKTAAATDPVAAVWMALPASAVNARVGSDGWWYDLSDGHKLEHAEAALRQQQVVAATIGATVDTGSGWWLDNGDNHQLTHGEAWERYQALHQGQTIGSAPVTGSTPWVPAVRPQGTTPYGTTQTAPIASMAGLTPTMLLLIAAAAGAVFLLGKRRAA